MRNHFPPLLALTAFLLALWAAPHAAHAADKTVRYGQHILYKGAVNAQGQPAGRGTLTYTLGKCRMTVSGVFDRQTVSSATWTWRGEREALKGGGKLLLDIHPQGRSMEMTIVNGTAQKTQKDAHTNALSFLNTPIDVSGQRLVVKPYQSASARFLVIEPTAPFPVTFRATYHRKPGTVSGETTLPSLNFNETYGHYILFHPDGATLPTAYRRGGDPIGLMYRDAERGYILSGEQAAFAWSSGTHRVETTTPPPGSGYNRGFYGRVACGDTWEFVGHFEPKAVMPPASAGKHTPAELLAAFSLVGDSLSAGAVTLLQGQRVWSDGTVETWTDGICHTTPIDPMAQMEWLMTPGAEWSGTATADGTLTHSGKPGWQVRRLPHNSTEATPWVYAAFHADTLAWVRRDVAFDLNRVRRALCLHHLKQRKGVAKGWDADKTRQVEAELAKTPDVKLSRKAVLAFTALGDSIEAARRQCFQGKMAVWQLEESIRVAERKASTLLHAAMQKGLASSARQLLKEVEQEYKMVFALRRYDIKQTGARSVAMILNGQGLAVVQTFTLTPAGEMVSSYEVQPMNPE